MVMFVVLAGNVSSTDWMLLMPTSTGPWFAFWFGSRQGGQGEEDDVKLWKTKTNL